MNHTAKLTTRSRDPEAVAKALSVDNRNLEGQRVKTTAKPGGALESTIECDDLRSLLASVDDLIRSQIVAESVVQ
jgi:hypothetical protein